MIFSLPLLSIALAAGAAGRAGPVYSLDRTLRVDTPLDMVEVADLDTRGWTSLSVEGWAKLDTYHTSPQADRHILTKEWDQCVAPWEEFTVGVYNDLNVGEPDRPKKLNFGLTLDGRPYVAKSASAFPLHRWTHFAAVWDGRE